MISEGEYVLPANVVKWHGLKHIMDMQSEAEMGLMSMYDTGLIQYTDEEGAEEPEEVEAAETDAPEETILLHRQSRRLVCFHELLHKTLCHGTRGEAYLVKGV